MINTEAPLPVTACVFREKLPQPLLLVTGTHISRSCVCARIVRIVRGSTTVSEMMFSLLSETLSTLP